MFCCRACTLFHCTPFRMQCRIPICCMPSFFVSKYVPTLAMKFSHHGAIFQFIALFDARCYVNIFTYKLLAYCPLPYNNYSTTHGSENVVFYHWPILHNSMYISDNISPYSTILILQNASTSSVDREFRCSFGGLHSIWDKPVIRFFWQTEISLNLLYFWNPKISMIRYK